MTSNTDITLYAGFMHNLVDLIGRDTWLRGGSCNIQDFSG
jgi:hypothetical protein